jgi:DNA modification methylase
MQSQLHLFQSHHKATRFDPALWQGSFNDRESSLHQLSPYVGKLKSGMVRVLLETFSHPGEWVCDPFSGSGVVPLESLILKRKAAANDLSLYAYVLTMGKVIAPPGLCKALKNAERLISMVKEKKNSIDEKGMPDWVREFFHPETLKEILVAFEELNKSKDYFLMACLCGILHHVRPGFLSYPASHLTPYLRKNKYPSEQYAEMYQYRDLESRLRAKVIRMYRRTMIEEWWTKNDYHVTQTNTMALKFDSSSQDLIISSPPYFGALDYARDNRLRLWFLGDKDWKKLDKSLTANDKVYLPQMGQCLIEMHRVLKRNKHCILVLGDVERNGKNHATAEIIADLACEVTNKGFAIEEIFSDIIPDERRSRRRTRTTKCEKIVILKKVK